MCSRLRKKEKLQRVLSYICKILLQIRNLQLTDIPIVETSYICWFSCNLIFIFDFLPHLKIKENVRYMKVKKKTKKIKFITIVLFFQVTHNKYISVFRLREQMESKYEFLIIGLHLRGRRSSLGADQLPAPMGFLFLITKPLQRRVYTRQGFKF